MIRFEKAEERHIAELKIREIDRQEIWAAAHITPEDSIRAGLTDEAWACYFDNELACIFGCKPVTILSDEACPWMIASDLIERKQKAFLRRCRPVVEMWQERHSKLVNYCDDRNIVVKNWLKWLGFTIHEPAPYGYDGAMFCKFERNRDV